MCVGILLLVDKMTSWCRCHKLKVSLAQFHWMSIW